MSGSEVETYTSDAQVWPRETMEKKNKQNKTIKNPHQKLHRLFFFSPREQFILLSSDEYTKMCLFLPTDCRKSLVAFRGRNRHCGIINRDSFGMYGLRSHQIYLVLDEDSEARQIWGGALEPSWIPSSCRNPVFPHMAHLRVENMFAIIWSA